MPLVSCSKEQGIAVFELSNPPANTYSFEMMKELDAAILDARMDESVHVLVLTGAGEKFFCAGADINTLNSATPEFKYSFCLHANETLNRLEQTPKLVIAALNGHAVGGGLEVALAADLRVAGKDNGKIGLPEVKLGVLPGTGGTQRLARLVGRSRAIEMMVTGNLMSFDEAHALGLVNVVLARVPPKKASKAVGAIKRSVNSGLEAALAEGLALERELQQQLFLSRDAREGISAHIEKREPKFQGS
jgi:enoyl-CoA hydratase/carnithine racemase